MGNTTDRNDPGLAKIRPSGQQESYLVLSESERAKGFVRPVRVSYVHLACGLVTTMDRPVAEIYARSPSFYSCNFCCHCRKHFPLRGPDGAENFRWDDDGTPVGS